MEPSEIEAKFTGFIRAQLIGLAEKIARDFSEESYQHELEQLNGDPVYSKFSFNRPEYVLIRFMGRISISIGRRLGEIYDKMPRYIAAARFNLDSSIIAPTYDNLELDIALRFTDLTGTDQLHVRNVTEEYIAGELLGGLGIEIRYNFNPNDSSRIRKDLLMGQNLVKEGLRPIYLVFSSISPRNDAISRLTQSGWTFLVGDEALSFINDILEVDLQAILDKEEVSMEIKKAVDEIVLAP